METIKEVLMRRDGLSEDEANYLIINATEDFHFRCELGENPNDICEEWFGLEPDYIMELM